LAIESGVDVIVEQASGSLDELARSTRMATSNVSRKQIKLTFATTGSSARPCWSGRSMSSTLLLQSDNHCA